ncbi:trigger factor [Marinitoga hydrogenitolerans DSM 16785]|uniref:Trigger factor n=1 Tax=Marinitoga hydrogenitolerans (strain DSM 16785 / JCM 12826 / AT1271) TaxID=1122195 RepID=A0A1M4T0K1_MARH1|nr:trigger factor [Marinitoga hydrogenitolerans]SHE37989.1 trigger factor [Marinitoga hydrogenitolerans DSM 16785]
MQKEIISEEKNVKRYLVKFDKKDIDNAENQIVRELNQRYTFHGFRKGKVPKKVMKIKFGEDFAEMVREILIEKVEDEFKDAKVLFGPYIESFALDSDSAEVEVLIHEHPEVVSTKFEELKVEVPTEKEIVEKFVEDRIKDLLEENPILEEKEEPAEIGDLVKVKYTVLNEEGKELFKDKESEYVLYEEDKRPMVTDLIGKKKGDYVEINREFEDKKYLYQITVEGVFKRIVPELTDDIAKTLDAEINSVLELKEKLSKEGAESFKVWKDDYIKNYVLAELHKYVEVDVSDETIDDFVNKTLERVKQNGKYEEEVEKHGGEEAYINELKEQALKSIKEMTIINKIADENDIKVEEKELSDSVHSFAQMYRIPYDKAREIIYSNAEILGNLMWDILSKKVAEYIAEKVQVIEVEDFEEKQKEKEEKEEN